VAFVKVHRVATLIVRAHPNIVIARHERFATRQAIKESQRPVKILAGANVPGQEQDIGRLVEQVRNEFVRGAVARRVACAIVQVGTDGDS
jgi:hypothetical protein